MTSSLSPRVSIITPVFNCERYLAETLTSVREQAGVTFEHIIINDGSTDSSASIVKNHTPLYPPDSCVVVHQANSGEAQAVNRAWALTRGEYVVVVNADDPLRPGALTRLVEVLDKYEQAVVAYPDWMMIDESGLTIKIKRPHNYSRQALVADFVCLPGPGAMIRRASLESALPRDPSYRYVSDYHLWLRLCLVGEMVHVPEVLASWRLHSASATSMGRGPAIALEMMRVTDEFFDSESLPTEVHNWRRQAHAMSRYYAAIQKLYDQSVSGRRLMLISLFTLFRRRAKYPTDRRQLLGVLAVLLHPLSKSVARLLGRGW